MAEASRQHAVIQEVKIIHAEDNLEEVVRGLATGLEHHLKLPGQADYDRQKAPNADLIIKQLEDSIKNGIPILLYISDNMLQLFKKKESKALKNLLKKDSGGQTRWIAILLGVITNKDQEKKVLGSGKEALGGVIKSEDFSMSEIGNVIDAAHKIWKGPEAVLPTEAAFPDEDESLPGDAVAMEETPALENIPTTEELTLPLAPPEFTMIYYGSHHRMKKFISDISFSLMIYLELETSPHFHNFSQNDDAAVILEKILRQLRGVVAGHHRSVLVISSDLIKLLSRVGHEEFVRLCVLADDRALPSLTFLLHNVFVEDVHTLSPQLAETVEGRYYLFEGKGNIDGAAYNLSRNLQVGNNLEAEENDESIILRPNRAEVNEHVDQMISTGEVNAIPKVTALNAKVVSASGDSIPNPSGSLVHEGFQPAGAIRGAIGGAAAVVYPGMESASSTNDGRNPESGENNGRTMTRPARMEFDHHRDFVITPEEDGVINKVKSRKEKVVSSGGVSIPPRSERLTQSDCQSVCQQPLGNLAAGGVASSHTGHRTQEGGSVTSSNRSRDNLSFSMEYRKTNPSHLSQSGPSMQRYPGAASGATFGKDPSQATQSSIATGPGEGEKAHSLISKASSTSLIQGQQLLGQGDPKHTDMGQQARGPAYSHGPSPTGDTTPQDLTGHPPPSLYRAPQSGPHLHGITSQSMGMPYRPAQPNGAPGTRPQAQPSHRPPAPGTAEYMQYYGSYPNAYPQQMASAHHPPGVQPASAQTQYQGFRAPYMQHSNTPIQPASHQGYGGQPIQNSPMQPASAQGPPQASPQLVHSRSVPAMQLHTNPPVQAGPDMPLLSLPIGVKHTICQKLNIKKISAMYWRHFAEEIGVTGDEIGVWESQNNCNYMEQLFTWISTNREGYTIREFYILSDTFKRPDIRKILEEWEVKHLQRQASSRF